MPEAGVVATDGSTLRRDGSALRAAQGFTMIEIAISLAIISFALLAIIGILPWGMNAQKENRQETIINQDATVFMDAIRSGSRGADDLTNYVMAITNYVTSLRADRTAMGPPQANWYTKIASGPGTNTGWPINSGYRIVGLLSTPKLTPVIRLGRVVAYTSNYVVACVRSLSGPVSEKPPQADPGVRDLGLSYRMLSDVISQPYDTNWFNTAGLPTNSPQYSAALYKSNLVMNLQTNLHDVRLLFRWPLLPTGEAGSGRQVYRAMVAGVLTNEPGTPFFFIEPRMYQQVKSP
jgi:prepilin-type N-terminal cleavage/methylation domain-containing protein